ncbi:MAG: hypothetical protein AAF614_27555 [Chloroflexota bacterium]
MLKQTTLIMALVTLFSFMLAGCVGETAVSPPPTDIEGPAFVLFYTDN